MTTGDVSGEVCYEWSLDFVAITWITSTKLSFVYTGCQAIGRVSYIRIYLCYFCFQ